MPELPEVETVRRMIAAHALGRKVARVWRSRHRLHAASKTRLDRGLEGRTLERMERRGKYLLFGFDGDRWLLSHLGMSGRWLFHERPTSPRPPHVHAILEFEDGSALWFQDPRRFGQLRTLTGVQLEEDPSLGLLGPDPIASPPTGGGLASRAQGLRASIKSFLLDQKRIAGIGNIYASEVLFRSGVDPRRATGRLTPKEWERIAREIRQVLDEAIDRMGTTFSSYRTLWNEPGQYGEQLRVYDRGGQPCRACGTPVRRIVQGARATFFCPRCQPRGAPKRRSSAR